MADLQSSQSESAACPWCRGEGLDAVSHFLLLRARYSYLYRWDATKWIGLSSDAMVDAAAYGGEPRDRPFDGWDLGRCLVTRELAPPALHERMDEILVGWRKLIEDSDTYHGIEAAESMVRNHAERVRAQLDGLIEGAL